jgi:hypothetical protein
MTADKTGLAEGQDLATEQPTKPETDTDLVLLDVSSTISKFVQSRISSIVILPKYLESPTAFLSYIEILFKNIPVQPMVDNIKEITLLIFLQIPDNYFADIQIVKALLYQFKKARIPLWILFNKLSDEFCESHLDIKTEKEQNSSIKNEDFGSKKDEVYKFYLHNIECLALTDQQLQDFFKFLETNPYTEYDPKPNNSIRDEYGYPTYRQYSVGFINNENANNFISKFISAYTQIFSHEALLDGFLKLILKLQNKGIRFDLDIDLPPNTIWSKKLIRTLLEADIQITNIPFKYRFEPDILALTDSYECELFDSEELCEITNVAKLKKLIPVSNIHTKVQLLFRIKELLNNDEKFKAYVISLNDQKILREGMGFYIVGRYVHLDDLELLKILSRLGESPVLEDFERIVLENQSLDLTDLFHQIRKQKEFTNVRTFEGLTYFDIAHSNQNIPCSQARAYFGLPEAFKKSIILRDYFISLVPLKDSYSFLFMFSEEELQALLSDKPELAVNRPYLLKYLDTASEIDYSQIHLDAAKNSISALEHIPAKFLRDKEFALKLLEVCPHAIYGIPLSIKIEDEVLEKTFRKHSSPHQLTAVIQRSSIELAAKLLLLNNNNVNIGYQLAELHKLDPTKVEEILMIVLRTKSLSELLPKIKDQTILAILTALKKSGRI